MKMRKLVKMTGWIFLSWVLMSSVPGVPFAVSQSLSPSDQVQALGDARLSLIQGDVAIQTKETGEEWGAAVINTPLIPGTKIWNPEKGRSEIQFFDGSYLRASEDTEIDITNLGVGSNGDVVQVGVPQGRSYVSYAGSDAQNSVFQVDTPITSIMSYGPSKFQVDIYNDGATEVSVLRGSVYVQGQNGRTLVDSGTMLSMDSNQNAELSAMRPEDAWISWNLSRDYSLARAGDSSRYLPASLDVYSNDFDTHGRWTNTADYGYVWTPIGVVADWAPYRAGRWCWIGDDYVWVSYEPWGWVPYHYGRWAFIRNTGWCWVPPPAAAVYWAPGFVAWIHTPTYVSWVPLAPRETYYGQGYYGPWSVDVRKVNINRINITNVYINTQVVNAVTVVGRQTFLTGRPERIANVPRNPFKEGVRVSAGRPQITPVRATALPDPSRTVPRNVLPSGDVLARAKKIEHRPVALHQDVSVFRPGRQVPSMPVTRVEHPKPIATVQKGQPQIKGKEVGPQKGQTGGPSAPSTQREFGVAPQHQGPSSTPRVQRKELEPSGQSKTTPPLQRREAAPSSVPKGQTGGPSAPSTQRKFGVAPQHQGPSSTPPVQRKELEPSGQSKTTPPLQRREAAPPSVPKGQTGGPSAPSTQREFAVAPQHPGQSSTPPLQRKKPNPSVQVNKPTPPTARRESPPPAQTSRPLPLSSTPEPKGPSGPSVQRNMGATPQHVGQPSSPPVQRKEPNPSIQTNRPTPPTTRRESAPPAQMSRPVPPSPTPAPKGPSGPAVQRNMGVAPPHVGQPSAPPAQSRPQGATPGTPHTGTKEKEKR
jgi:Family of unknown function (DUF6600)/FecR protein